MKIKEFYEKMKDLISDKVIVHKGADILYTGYLNEDRIYAYLMDSTITDICIGDKGLLVEIATN